MKYLRQSNFELLRIVSILMVLMMHAYGQVASGSKVQTDLNIEFGHLINAVCNTGVTCFILISGWFGIRRKWHRLIDLVVVSVVFTLALSMVHNGFSDFDTLIAPVLGLFKYQKWFLACYVILYCIAPYLNSYIDKTDRAEHRNLVVTLFVLLGVIPTLFEAPNGSVVYFGGKDIAYVMFLYILGRYLRLYHDREKPRKLLLIILLLSTTFLQLEHGTRPYLVSDCSPFILLSSLCVFYLFHGFHFRSRLVNSLASGVLVVYVVEALRLDVDEYIGLSTSGSESYMPLLLIAEVLIVFFIATFAEKLYRYVINNAKCLFAAYGKK